MECEVPALSSRAYDHGKWLHVQSYLLWNLLYAILEVSELKLLSYFVFEDHNHIYVPKNLVRLQKATFYKIKLVNAHLSQPFPSRDIKLRLVYNDNPPHSH